MNGPSYHNNTSITVDLETKPTMQTEQNFSLQIKKIPGKKEKKIEHLLASIRQFVVPENIHTPPPCPHTE